MRIRSLFIPFALGLVTVLLALGSLRAEESAVTAAPAAGTRYVAATGDDTGNDCSSHAAPCRTIQHAVDVADAADTIKVAAGTYTDVHVRPRSDVTTTGVVTQVLYISKTLTVRGGYTTTDWSTSYPISQTTALDAQGKGRVLFMTGDISPTIQGLQINGGDATDIGNQGGGICSVGTSPIVAGNVISGNIGGTAGYARGGGIYVEGGTASALIADNQILHNVATTSLPDSGHGGGLYLNASAATVESNIIKGNIAHPNGWGVGGGIYLYTDTATLRMNTVVSNIAGMGHRGFGGGVMLYDSSATVVSNAVERNIASTSNLGNGGGIMLELSDARLAGNTVRENIAATADGGWGGGLSLVWSDVTLQNNTVCSNSASTANWGRGGGLYFEDSTAKLVGGSASSNYASTTSDGWGAGYFVFRGQVVLSETQITSNVATGGAGGLLVYAAHMSIHESTIISNTAENGSGGGALGEDCVVTVTHSLFSHNRANSGGGGGMGVWNTEALVDGNEFRNNEVTGESGGGFVGSMGSVVTVTNNLIADNSATGVGGGMGVYWDTSAWIFGNEVRNNQDGSAGGGIVGWGDCKISLVSNTIQFNSAPTGGGVDLWNIAGARIVSNLIEGNSATDRGGGGILIDYGSGNRVERNVIRDNDAKWGGGLHLYETDFVLTNNLISYNSADDRGGGIYPSRSNGTIINTTVVSNQAAVGGGLFAHCLPTQTVRVTNCIFWDDTGDEIAGDGYAVSYSNIAGGAPGPGNIADDPAFVDPESHDYHLEVGSPCIDRGTPSGAPIYDLDGTGRDTIPDIGAYEWTGTEVFLPLVLKTYPSETVNRSPYRPSTPSPGAGATNQSVDVTLSWRGGDPDGDIVIYDIYLEANDSTPDTLVCNDVTSAYCDPGVLKYDKHYHWKVVSSDEHGSSTTSPVWDFTTESSPSAFLTAYAAFDSVVMTDGAHMPLDAGTYEVSVSSDLNISSGEPAFDLDKVVIWAHTPGHPDGWYWVVEEGSSQTIIQSGSLDVYAFLLDTDFGNNTGSATVTFTELSDASEQATEALDSSAELTVYGASHTVVMTDGAYMTLDAGTYEVSVSSKLNISSGEPDFDLDKVGVWTPSPGDPDAWYWVVEEGSPQTITWPASENYEVYAFLLDTDSGNNTGSATVTFTPATSSLQSPPRGATAVPKMLRLPARLRGARPWMSKASPRQAGGTAGPNVGP